ncbi:MAG: hypothetical protein R3C52_04970 [Hyphomonadaceae bacterium]
MQRAKVRSIRRFLTGDACYRPETFARGYVWTAPELAQLLIDLEDNARTEFHRPSRESLYLGVMTAAPGRRGSEFYLFDGLQRALAITMILAFARDRLPFGYERARLNRMLFRKSLFGRARARIGLYGDEHDFLVRHILSPDATLQLPRSAEDGGARRILMSARFLHRAFQAFSADRIRELLDALLDRSAVVVSVCPPHEIGAAVSRARMLAPPPVEREQPPAPVMSITPRKIAVSTDAETLRPRKPRRDTRSQHPGSPDYRPHAE